MHDDTMHKMDRGHPPGRRADVSWDAALFSRRESALYLFDVYYVLIARDV